LLSDVVSGDVGLTITYNPDKPKANIAGTAQYIPPEMVRGAGYDTSADIWSLVFALPASSFRPVIQFRLRGFGYILLVFA
jgi:serine/threonine protein kinase